MVGLIEWRDIPGYEGRYQISSDGQVKSLYRRVVDRNGGTRTIRERILAPKKCGYGYLAGAMRPEGTKRFKNYYIHRLVAISFLGPAQSGFEVNHKDEDKENNDVSNLEWIPKKENLSYGTREKRCSVRGLERSKRIIAIKDGVVVKDYSSLHDAAKDGFSRYHIKQCCEGAAKAHKGYRWAYKEAAPGVTSTEGDTAEQGPTEDTTIITAGKEEVKP